MATRFCIPPESSEGYLSTASVSSVCSIRAITFFLISFGLMRVVRLRGIAMLSKTVMESKRALFLKEITDLAPVVIPFPLPHLMNGFSHKQDRPRVRRKQTDHMFKQDALACAAFAHDRGDLILIDLQN